MLSLHIPDTLRSEKSVDLASLGLRIDKYIRSGQFGSVFHGFLDDIEIAAKVVNCNCQFTKEVEALNILRNAPNIVRMQDLQICGNDESVLILEYLPNGELFDLVSIAGPFKENLTRTCMKQILEAIHSCHINGIYHRDLKLENIMLSETFALTIIDFGLCHIEKHNLRVDEREITGEVGTLTYIAPEILDGSLYRGSEADMWSIGVILFIMLIGHAPFLEARRGDYWFDKIITNDVDTFWLSHEANTNARISHSAKDLLIRMLQTTPRNRLKLEEVFAHPFMQGEAMPSEEYVSVMTSLRNKVKLDQHTDVVDSDSSPFPSILLSSSRSLEHTLGVSNDSPTSVYDLFQFSTLSTDIEHLHKRLKLSDI